MPITSTTTPAGGVVIDHSTAMERGGGGENNEDGATATAPRTDPLPLSQARVGDALQVRLGVALQLRPSVQQVRLQLAHQQQRTQQLQRAT